ncbi:MAG: RimK/LysX family protein [Flavobacteriales bacterium]|uniref:ATP-dependent zinc protease family protein n=1 Tax=Candidatus Ulvibacter alkanivorans TaxID=2267620 RepID=UPI000DF178C3|nr:RimK/LysX family protein [Candidatus Ulvibacter alkanivorans]MCH2490018.1 RimK/LysX family protein [Flavobacteriales bacterium]
MKRNIGRIDKADFPLLNLENVDVKIDTGAFTSTIHCQNVKVEDNYLKCNFLDEAHPDYHKREIVFDTYDVKVVKSSNGVAQARYRIVTEIILFGKTYPIFLTLSDREEMKYPVLLGRKFLTKRFVVDINKVNLSYKLKMKK